MSINPFDVRGSNIPWEWRGPVCDVIDTAAVVVLGIKHELEIEPSPDLVIGLTRMILERRAPDVEAES